MFLLFNFPSNNQWPISSVAELVDGFLVDGCLYELLESFLVKVVSEDLFALLSCKLGYVYGYSLGRHKDYIYYHRL